MYMQDNYDIPFGNIACSNIFSNINSNISKHNELLMQSQSIPCKQQHNISNNKIVSSNNINQNQLSNDISNINQLQKCNNKNNLCDNTANISPVICDSGINTKIDNRSMFPDSEDYLCFLEYMKNKKNNINKNNIGDIKNNTIDNTHNIVLNKNVLNKHIYTIYGYHILSKHILYFIILLITIYIIYKIWKWYNKNNT